MADKSIRITIATALNAAGFTATKRAISNLVSGTKEVAAKVGGNLMNIKAGFDMVAGAASKLLQVMSKGMEFERMTVAFKSLTGSMELAKAHMKDLQDLGRTPPFSLEQFAAASQAMMKMTGGMVGFRKEMEIVGDTAAATGNDISTVGRAFGLAYQVIRDGQDFGLAGQQLYSLGLMTKKQVAEFAELSKAGTDNVAVWQKLMDVFGRYKGAMEATEKTTKGLVEAIQGEATVAITDLSSALSESAKPALESILSKMRELGDDGSIEDWADKTVDAAERVGSAFKTVAEKIGNFLGIGKANTQNTLMASLGGIGAGLAEGGDYGGGWSGFRKAQLAYVATHASNERVAEGASKSLNKRMRASGEWTEDTDVRKEYAKADKEDRADNRSRAQERKAKRDAERAKTEAEAEKRIREDMARAQAETTAKFEKARRDAMDETMAKLRELAGMDADVDVSVNVDDPKPVKVKVKAPAPVDVKANEPAPVDVKANEPAPVTVDVVQPAPVNPEVETPAPVKATVIEPKAVTPKVETPAPVKATVVSDKVKIDAPKVDPIKVPVDVPVVAPKVETPDAVTPEVNAPDPVKAEVKEPDPVDVRVKEPDDVKVGVVVDTDGFDELEERLKSIPESVRPDLSGVKKALAELATARTEEELKAAKASVDAAMRLQKAEEARFAKAQAALRASAESAEEFVAQYEQDASDAAKEAAKAELELRREALRELHDERMRQIDDEQRRLQAEIEALKDLGADDPMRRAANMNQGDEIRNRRQKVRNDSRMADAETKLLQKMIDKGATINDPSKLGRLSNLEQAALERLRLVKKQQDAERLQKERDAREREMAKSLKNIDDRLKDVGL